MDTRTLQGSESREKRLPSTLKPFPNSQSKPSRSLPEALNALDPRSPYASEPCSPLNPNLNPIPNMTILSYSFLLKYSCIYTHILVILYHDTLVLLHIEPDGHWSSSEKPQPGARVGLPGEAPQSTRARGALAAKGWGKGSQGSFKGSCGGSFKGRLEKNGAGDGGQFLLGRRFEDPAGKFSRRPAAFLEDVRSVSTALACDDLAMQRRTASCSMRPMFRQRPWRSCTVINTLCLCLSSPILFLWQLLLLPTFDDEHSILAPVATTITLAKASLSAFLIAIHLLGSSLPQLQVRRPYDTKSHIRFLVCCCYDL